MEKNVNVSYIAILEGLGLDIFSFKQNIRSQRFRIHVRTQKITSNGDSTIDVQYKTTKAHADFANLRNI